MDYSQKRERKRATPFSLDFCAPGQFVFVLFSPFFLPDSASLENDIARRYDTLMILKRMELCFFFHASLEQTEKPTRFSDLMTCHTCKRTGSYGQSG